MEKIYDFKALTSKGKELDFAQFEGKVLLIVNTASKCGFTPQFAGLETLNQKYKDKGLVVIGFPCNQFKEQDPGTDGQIEEFCQLNYGVTFQIMKKTAWRKTATSSGTSPSSSFRKMAKPSSVMLRLQTQKISKRTLKISSIKVYKQELNHHACRIATRQSNLFPAIHSFKADYTGLHSYTVGIGHHLPTIPRANGTLGKRQPTC